MSGVKRSMGKGMLVSISSTVSGIPITDPIMPQSKWYLLANAGNAASVSLLVFISSKGSSPSKATNLATVLPMSIINFTGSKVQYLFEIRSYKTESFTFLSKNMVKRHLLL